MVRDRTGHIPGRWAVGDPVAGWSQPDGDTGRMTRQLYIGAPLWPAFRQCPASNPGRRVAGSWRGIAVVHAGRTGSACRQDGCPRTCGNGPGVGADPRGDGVGIIRPVMSGHCMAGRSCDLVRNILCLPRQVRIRHPLIPARHRPAWLRRHRGHAVVTTTGQPSAGCHPAEPMVRENPPIACPSGA